MLVPSAKKNENLKGFQNETLMNLLIHKGA